MEMGGDKGGIHSPWYPNRFTAMVNPDKVGGRRKSVHGYSSGGVLVVGSSSTSSHTVPTVCVEPAQEDMSKPPPSAASSTSSSSTTAPSTAPPLVTAHPKPAPQPVRGKPPITPNGRGSRKPLSTPLLTTTPNGAPAPRIHTAQPSPSSSSSATMPDDMMLLAKLEEANRLLENDSRSLQVLSPRHQARSPHHTHSRQGSVSSVISNASVSSNSEDITGSPEDIWNRWGKIVNDWETISKKKPGQIKELVRRGIPHHFRGIAWQLICSAHNSPAKDQYAELLKMTSPSEKLIRRDITRTYPEHHFFKEKNGLGQESLFNVMKAYSLVDREVGYCQGSAFIVGLLLMQMPEEEAFAVMVKVMQEYRLRELFKPSMAELGLCMFQLECMIQEQLPHVYAHFQAQSFCVSMFASSWFLTIFTTTLPLAVACRIFDVFLSEGIEIVFKVGFSILEMHQTQLLALDMEGMLKLLQKQIPLSVEAEQEQLFTNAYQVKYNAKKMKKLEKEYNALKTKEQEEQVELRRLRTENRLLRQRIENLEKETATLADRLIHDQVQFATQTEEMYSLKRDVSQLNAKVAAAAVVAANAASSPDRNNVRSNSTSSGSSTEAQADSEKVEKLTKQLSDLRHWEQESKACIRQLREKVRQVEHANRQLQADPKDEIQSCQEELIACKLREAEANLSMKELQQKVVELERHWQKYVEKQAALMASPGSNNKAHKGELKATQDELMATRIKEAQSVSELKEMKQKVMELETQNHISERHCKRLEVEVNKLKEQLDEGDLRDKDLHQQIKEMERKANTLESQKKEDEMMMRLKSAEHAQGVAEMRQRIAELEIENQELITAGALRDRGESVDLTQKVSELQEQVMQLKMARRLQSMSASMALSTLSMGDTESDSDMESTVAKHQLRLTDSMSLTSGMTLDDLRPPPPPLQESSDSDDYDNGIDEQNKRHSVVRRKRRTHADTDKTPTQESVNVGGFTLVENGLRDINGTMSGVGGKGTGGGGRLSEDDDESVTTSEMESTTTCSNMASDTSSQSSHSSHVITASASKLDQIPEPVDV